ncbi:hypothetical protein J1N35_024032 [Gossypium stocksii]|uniref:Uncharacterized protein n=1 Tax=Gossypium stocksii TaxID=47602 RepID=A0A9D3VK87_9ROSI|nr:hypothetical protein J1N35_024032 [Gossypium stocksii]
MAPTEEGGGSVGAVSTDQAIIDNSTNNDSVGIDMPCTDVALSCGELANLRSLDKTFKGGQPTLRDKPLIRKVPSILHRNEDFKKYFKPKVISIGPLHHDDPTLHESKELKLKLASHFVNNIDVHKDSLYSNMKKEIDGLKKCYDPQELEKYSDHDEKLAWMFFVDGCAILQAVYMRYGQDYCRTSNELVIKNELLTFVYSDLFLLENQLPFRVLELLTRSSKNGEKFLEAIRRFINRTVEEPQSHQQDSDHKRTKRHHSRSFCNVKELKNAGIWLKASETSCLTDISFNRFFFVGKLQLPPITVDDSTMNLIAYEMCPDFYDNNFAFTSYMGFLDSLIDEAEDVKELGDAGILYNRLGSDKEMAKLIKKMNIDLVPGPMIYKHVQLQIHNHRNNMWIKYPAQFYRTFFRTRWTFFAFVGAIAALFIGALQAHYTIHQPK